MLLGPELCSGLIPEQLTSQLEELHGLLSRCKQICKSQPLYDSLTTFPVQQHTHTTSSLNHNILKHPECTTFFLHVLYPLICTPDFID